MKKQINKFEDIEAWRKSQKLCINVYKLFKKSRDFGFRDQICRASVSISNNIAEGFERHTKKEFIAFLYIAKASCGEVRSMLYLALDLGYMNENNFKIMNKQATDTSKLVLGFIKYLKRDNFRTF